MKLIKKYKNRRLYDLEMSQYVTIEDLQRYVLDKRPFQVIDASTNQDITTITLLQIFVEMESGALPFLSPELLRQLIILANHPMNRFYQTMLKQMMMSWLP